MKPITPTLEVMAPAKPKHTKQKRGRGILNREGKGAKPERGKEHTKLREAESNCASAPSFSSRKANKTASFMEMGNWTDGSNIVAK